MRNYTCKQKSPEFPAIFVYLPGYANLVSKLQDTPVKYWILFCTPPGLNIKDDRSSEHKRSDDILDGDVPAQQVHAVGQ